MANSLTNNTLYCLFILIFKKEIVDFIILLTCRPPYSCYYAFFLFLFFCFFLLKKTCFIFPYFTYCYTIVCYFHMGWLGCCLEHRRGTSANGRDVDDGGSWRWTPSGCHVDRLASALLHAPIRRYDDGPRLLSHARPW